MVRRAALVPASLALFVLLAAPPLLGAALPDGPGEVTRPGWKTAFLGFGFVLLFLAVVWLPAAFAATWRRLKDQPKPWLAALGAIVLAGAILRLFVVPHGVVTQYMGYLLTNRAAELVEIPRYGVGVQVLWRAVFQVFPTDHATAIALHALLGSLTLVWLPAALLRAGMRPSGTLVATALAAFLPQFLWSDASDSLTVPVFFFTFGAIVFAQEYLTTKSWNALAGAVIWLAFAAHVRPEHVVFGPLLLLVFVAAGGTGSLRERLRAPLVGWLAGVGGFVALVVPQIVYAFHMRAVMLGRGGWPHTFGEILPDLPYLFVQHNALFDPRMVPLALGPLAVVALFTARGWAARRFRLTLLALAVVWTCFYYIDLSVASAPRLHVVLTLPAAILVGGFFGDLWRWRPGAGAVRWVGPAFAVAALATVALGVPSAAAWYFQPTNEAEEDRLFRDALAAIPEGEPFVLVRLGRGDKPEGDDTHLHLPDYLARPPARKGYVMSVSELRARPALPDRAIYWYRGLRCYSKLRREDEPPPPETWATGCQAMEDTFELEPVLTRMVPNHGDLMLPYYPAEKEFPVGLYRVTGRKETAPAVAAPPPRPPLDPPDEPDLPKAKVIPPGQEALLVKMLGKDAELPGGCRYESATVEMTFVKARFACPDGAATIELRAAAAVADAAAKTAEFALVAGEGVPPALVDAVAESVRAHEGAWRWSEANAPGAAPVETEPREPPPDDVSPEFRTKYEQVNRFYAESRHAEALPICIELARERPEWGGILGMLVANLAPTQPDAARVKAFIAAADADPADPLAQFIAGVGAHYSAHYKAKSVEEKKALYRKSIEYLKRARPAFDFEPRVFIYLAVSHFRLGLQEEAEGYIEKALQLDRTDPDAFYCRAEIFQRKDPERSLADLQKYIDMTSGEGHITKGEKPARVQHMKEKLEARVRGEPVDEELWDPLEGD